MIVNLFLSHLAFAGDRHQIRKQRVTGLDLAGARADDGEIRSEHIGTELQRVQGATDVVRTWCTIERPNAVLKLNLIANLIWNFLLEQGGKQNSKIEIPSC